MFDHAVLTVVAETT